MSNMISFRSLGDMANVDMSMRQAYLLACDMGRGTEFLHQWCYGGPGTDEFRAYLRSFHEQVEALEHDERFDRAANALALDIEQGTTTLIPDPIEWGPQSDQWEATLARYWHKAGGDLNLNNEAMLILFEIRKPYERIMNVRDSLVVTK